MILTSLLELLWVPSLWIACEQLYKRMEIYLDEIKVTSNLENSKNKLWIWLNLIFKLQYPIVLRWTIWCKWSAQRLFKTMRSWFAIFWQPASSFSTWFHSDSREWAGDPERLSETPKRMKPHIARSLSSILPMGPDVWSTVTSLFPGFPLLSSHLLWSLLSPWLQMLPFYPRDPPWGSGIYFPLGTIF